MLTLLTIVCTVGGYAQETLTDELTSQVLGLTASYSSFTNKKASSDALYCGCAYKNTSSQIQINGRGTSKGTKPNKVIGLVSTVSGGTIKSITIELKSSTNPLLVFGNNEAFVGSDDLTGNNKGTQIASITNTTKQTIIPTGNYKYVGFYSAKANYIKKITIVWEKAAPTPATTTTFGTNSGKTFTFTNGKLEGFTTPTATATKSDDNTDLSNLIEYTSDAADIVAVDSKTGELTFTNTKFGKATITATLPKTDTYQTSTDSYVVENKDNHTATSLSFNGTDVTLTEGKTDAGADFTGYTATEANNIDGTITYAASGDAVATVNPTTGTVTINPSVYGTTTITATFTPADPTQYSGSTATYQITNKKAVDLSEITFNVSEDKSNNSSQQIEDNLNKSIVKIYSTKAILGNGTDYRFYKDSKTTFSLTDPTRVITSIKFIGSNTIYPNFTTDKNTYDKASGTWTGYEESVTFTNPGSVIRNITQIIVTTAEKKPVPALSFAEATVTKELVAGTIDLQTITKPEDLDASAITYASSDDATAKVEGNTIHMYKTGEVTITATSAATDKYAAGTASYKLVIEDNRATDADFKFAAESYSEDLAKATDGIVTFNAANVLQNPNNLKVTYIISPESANATIGKADGKALIKVSGTYTITATAAANDTYKETTATCTLKVTNSAVEEKNIKFVAGVDKGNNSSTTADDTVEKGCVLISSESAALGRDDNYRFYSSTHTISTKIGKITKIEFVGNNIIDNKTSNPLTNLTSADNNYTCTDPNNGVWVGSAKEVVFTNSSQARATNIIVTVEVPKAKSYTLDETKTDNVIETYENANVTLQRTLEASHWNSFCVPFALDKDQVTQYFGEGTQLRTYEGRCENNIVYFATVDNIEAGKPYIMKPGNAVVTNPRFEGVSMVATGLDTNGNPQAVGDASTVQMKGIYNHVTLVQDKTNIYIGAGNKFYYPADAEACQMNGLRAYFIVPEGTDIKKLRANIDGATTSLGEIFDTEESNTPVYNLQGQCVGNSLSTLKSGIYVQNGKKVVVK